MFLGVPFDAGYIVDSLHFNDVNLIEYKSVFGMTDQTTLNIPISTYGFILSFHCGTVVYPKFGV